MKHRCLLSISVLLATTSFVSILSAIPLFSTPVEPASLDMPIFTDQTQEAGIHMVTTVIERFIPSIEPPDFKTHPMRSGAAAGDFNKDGWEDLFVLGGGGRADSLFINNGDGTFTDQAGTWGVKVKHAGIGTAVGDYNSDGWLDIFVTSMGYSQTIGPGHHRLYRNNGNFTFTDVAADAGVNVSSPVEPDGFSAAFGDYDLDGDLDLYVTGWKEQANGNHLFRNNGDETFSNISDEAMVKDLRVQGFSPCFSDMDGDRYPELLLAADFGTSRYYVNNQDGTFLDQTATAGTDYYAYGMGSAVADLNNDGLLDWFITSIYGPEVENADGNRLYLNQGNHRYQEVAKSSNVDDGAWGWGTIAVDVNHDGWLDLIETNGWPIISHYINQPAKLWLNNGDATFTDIALTSGLNHKLDGRGILNFDYDNDGDQDIVITSYDDELRLYRNDSASDDANWLRVYLDTSENQFLAPNGYGAKVTIKVGDISYMRKINGCTNFLSQSELSAHFGLAHVQHIDEVSVEWPDGNVTRLNDISANQSLIITSPAHSQLFFPIFLH